MSTPSRNTRQTVYAYDARALSTRRSIDTGWAQEIGRLIEQGYGFLDATYAPGGVLFRGMSRGVESAIEAGACGHFTHSATQRELEQDIGVFFCSQDLSDALTISRVWENDDSAVVVFPSDLFIHEWVARRAPVMAFAEAGIVFRYPFLLRPLGLDELTLLIRAPRSRVTSTLCEQVVLPDDVRGDRAACESFIKAILESRGHKSAAVTYGVEYPVPR